MRYDCPAKTIAPHVAGPKKRRGARRSLGLTSPTRPCRCSACSCCPQPNCSAAHWARAELPSSLLASRASAWLALLETHAGPRDTCFLILSFILHLSTRPHLEHAPGDALWSVVGERPTAEHICSLRWKAAGSTSKHFGTDKRAMGVFGLQTKDEKLAIAIAMPSTEWASGKILFDVRHKVGEWEER